MRSASSGGWPRPVRWSRRLTGGVAVGRVVGSGPGPARLRTKAA